MKTFATLALASAALLAGCAAPGQPDTAAPQPVSVQTALPGLTAPTGEPGLPSLHEAHPKPGQAIQAAGPFDDRFEIEGLAFDGKDVKGTIRITSDVSDLLELQVLAGFYDADGTLLGTARFEHHLDESEGHQHAGPPSEVEEFSIAAPAAAGNAVSAAVGVPVLVNE
ncbi:hypothetical protein [Sinomonas halotolerans]|uniref:Lipoprotein n=1 Tax=Sinomonas halotolerans TaxID=1644133 RepID=A0ABU9WYW8_9MICC